MNDRCSNLIKVDEPLLLFSQLIDVGPVSLCQALGTPEPKRATATMEERTNRISWLNARSNLFKKRKLLLCEPVVTNLIYHTNFLINTLHFRFFLQITTLESITFHQLVVTNIFWVVLSTHQLTSHAHIVHVS